jgi:hypothetical protein
MKALKGSAQEKALLERYARELNEHEDRVQALQPIAQTCSRRRKSPRKT